MIDKINYLETKDGIKYPLVFTMNVMEALQDKYGTIQAWVDLAERKGEPDIKAIKFFMTEAINEGIDIENEKTGEKRKPITLKKVGRILTEIGLSETANKIIKTVSESVQTGEQAKNMETTENQTE